MAKKTDIELKQGRCVIFLNILIRKYFPDIGKIKSFEDIAPRRNKILAEFYKGVPGYVVEDEIDKCLESYKKGTWVYKKDEDIIEDEFWGLWFNFAPTFISEIKD